MRLVEDDIVYPVLQRMLPVIIEAIAEILPSDGEDQKVSFWFMDGPDSGNSDFYIKHQPSGAVIKAHVHGDPERRIIAIAESLEHTDKWRLANLRSSGPNDTESGKCDYLAVMNYYGRSRWRALGRCIGYRCLIPAIAAWPRLENPRPKNPRRGRS